MKANERCSNVENFTQRKRAFAIKGWLSVQCSDGSQVRTPARFFATSCFLKCVWSWHIVARPWRRLISIGRKRVWWRRGSLRGVRAARGLSTCARHAPPGGVARDGNQVAGGLPVWLQNHPSAAHFVRIGRRFASPLRLKVLLARDGALGVRLHASS